MGRIWIIKPVWFEKDLHHSMQMKNILNQILFEQSVGLDINPHRIRVVVLGRFFRYLRILHWDEEPVSCSDPECIVDAIKALYNRLGLSAKDVVVRLQGRGVRHLMLDTPRLSQEAIAPFIAKELAKRLPPGMHVSRLIYDYQILSASSSGLGVLVVFCQPALYHETHDLLTNIGLNPVLVGGLSFDVLSAHSINNLEFFTHSYFYIYCAVEYAHLFLCHQGQLHHFQEISLNGYNQKSVQKIHSQLKQMISHLQKDENKAIQSVMLTGPNAGDVKDLLGDLDVKVHLESPLENVQPVKLSLNPEYAMAAGLAVKGLFPELNPLNLIPADVKPAKFEAQEKKKFMRHIFLLGAAICLLMLVMNLIRMFTSNAMETSDEQMLMMNDRMTTVQLADKEVKKLKRDLKQMQKLMTERSRISALMSEIGVHVPKRTWLNRLYIGPEQTKEELTPEQSIVYLEGLSISEDRITRLIAALEFSSVFKSVRLQEIRKLNKDEVWELTEEKYKRTVMQFKIFLELSEEFIVEL